MISQNLILSQVRGYLIGPVLDPQALLILRRRVVVGHGCFGLVFIQSSSENCSMWPTVGRIRLKEYVVSPSSGST